MKLTTESAVRRRVKARGLKFQKSRGRNKEWPRYGTYHVMNADRNEVVFGGKRNTFGASLAECAKYIKSHV
jgi:hypothetical protein